MIAIGLTISKPLKRRKEVFQTNSNTKRLNLCVCVCVCVCVYLKLLTPCSGGLVQLTLNLIQATGGLGLIDSHRVGFKRVIHALVKIEINNIKNYFCSTYLHEHVYCNIFSNLHSYTL